MIGYDSVSFAPVSKVLHNDIKMRHLDIIILISSEKQMLTI
jgi:hypothetical protein